MYELRRLRKSTYSAGEQFRTCASTRACTRTRTRIFILTLTLSLTLVPGSRESV